MGRETRARIDLTALQHNFTVAAERVPNARVMAVVKADGYGHGIEAVAGALAGHTERFAVACIEEAQRLRKAGISQPVVLLQGFHQAGDIASCCELQLEPVIHSGQQLNALSSTPPDQPLRIWLKINTGMNRLGFSPSAADQVIALARSISNVTLAGLVTHYACADDRNDDFSQQQNDVLAAISRRYPELEISAANSAAHFRDELDAFDWTRPGIMLYGATPMTSQSARELGLKPAMSLESVITATRMLAPGESVGYGASWRAESETLMGIVCIGYGDGYPRHAPSGTPVWINGQRTATIGRVSMDMLAVDLTPVADAKVGDPVELWGQHIPVDEVAAHAGTIGYELLTGVTARVPRIYNGV
ncbi:alanine racemase [Marinobacter sp. 1Y8]